MSTAVSRAAELHKFFQNVNTSAAGAAWEQLLVDNARRVSTPLALKLLSQMGLGSDTNTPVRVFENACGPGVIAPILQQVIKPDTLRQSSILCGDYSGPATELVKRRIESEGWVNTQAGKIDAQKTGLADAAFTHVATNIGFHVVPDSQGALNEAIRVLQPGGVLGFTTWHMEPGWMAEVKEAFRSFPFEAPCEMGLQTTAWGEWADVNWIRKTLESKGLRDVTVYVYAHLTRVENAESFVSGYGMMMDWVMSSNWSEELRKQHPREEVHALTRAYLEKKYGNEGWDMSWVAVIASGRLAPVDVAVA